jgi:hypothetical protein
MGCANLEHPYSGFLLSEWTTYFMYAIVSESFGALSSLALYDCERIFPDTDTALTWMT